MSASQTKPSAGPLQTSGPAPPPLVPGLSSLPQSHFSTDWPDSDTLCWHRAAEVTSSSEMTNKPSKVYFVSCSQIQSDPSAPPSPQDSSLGDLLSVNLMVLPSLKFGLIVSFQLLLIRSEAAAEFLLASLRLLPLFYLVEETLRFWWHQSQVSSQICFIAF